MINHIDPVRFWEGRPIGPQKANTEHMGSVHKGGVVFDYWVHNPWHGRLSLDVPMPEDPSAIPTAACQITPIDPTIDDDDDDWADQGDDDFYEDDYADSVSSGDDGDDLEQHEITVTRCI